MHLRTLVPTMLMLGMVVHRVLRRMMRHAPPRRRVVVRMLGAVIAACHALAGAPRAAPNASFAGRRSL